jgi:putative FmdB family regulatory protein
MPQYEYRCGACEREFEYTQRMSDPDLVKCEACGEDKLERLISWTAARSTAWKAALTGSNQKENMKGLHAVDTSVEKRFKGHAATPAAAPEPVVAATPAPKDDEST